MRERYEAASEYSWIVYIVAVMMFGGLAGYIIELQTGQRATAAPAMAAGTTAAPVEAQVRAPLVDENELRVYRDILGRDPKNVQAAVRAGNLLYDAQRYVEAIPFYQQAFALDPSDVNVSTDLGTALWYTGRADEALEQYARSLAINPRHAQTLYNLGIARADGKHDYGGAIKAWDTLLEISPGYPEAARVRSLLADARQRLSDRTPAPQ
jgi:tetratricopeptide (TPR) repeat protein